MLVIGLTGGIATGKSTVAATLRELGAQIIDADAISRALTSPGGRAADAVYARFGTLDRKALGRIVFSSDEARLDLNAIVHPMVHAEMEAAIRAATAEIVVLDVPLLYESGMETLADEVWVVYTSREEQVRRVMARDGLSPEAAEARINSQMPTEEKLRRADHSINTTGPYPETRAQVEALWRRAQQRTGASYGRLSDGIPTPTSSRRRSRSEARRIEQRMLESQIPEPELFVSRIPLPIAPTPASAPAPAAGGAPEVWDDTSTAVEMAPERGFLSRQRPLFWVVAAILLTLILTLAAIIGVGEWRQMQARKAEEARLLQLAEEKARYRFLYRDLVEGYSAQYGLDPAMVAAIIYNESRFDPQAVSKLGARGLMQIMEPTGGWIAETLDEDDGYSFDLMFDPETNIRFGTWYLSFLCRMFGNDLIKVAAGYHAGQGRVQGWLADTRYSSDGSTLEIIPFDDTNQYVQRVITAYEMYKKHYYTPEATEEPGHA